MKLFLIIFILAATHPAQQKQNELFGTWKIVKVKTNDGILTPTMDFFLTIGENQFRFNRDFNRCSTKSIITDTTIGYDGELCTRVCCDGEKDPIGGMDLYRGNYIVTEQTLVISNEKVKTYLEKVSNEK
jgi:hypothetical protein